MPFFPYVNKLTVECYSTYIVSKKRKKVWCFLKKIKNFFKAAFTLVFLDILGLIDYDV